MAAFPVSSAGQDAKLTWRTAPETNSSGFAIQHRRKGSFERVGFVDGTGTTSESDDYRFRVSDLKPGRHAFQLRQIDADGSAHLSPERQVEIDARRTGFRRTSPNPVTADQSVTSALSAK